MTSKQIAEAFAKMPEMAGCPTVLVVYSKGDALRTTRRELERMEAGYKREPGYEVCPYLKIDDDSEWSAPKLILAAGHTLGSIVQACFKSDGDAYEDINRALEAGLDELATARAWLALHEIDHEAWLRGIPKGEG